MGRRRRRKRGGGGGEEEEDKSNVERLTSSTLGIYFYSILK